MCSEASYGRARHQEWGIQAGMPWSETRAARTLLTVALGRAPRARECRRHTSVDCLYPAPARLCLYGRLCLHGRVQTLLTSRVLTRVPISDPHGKWCTHAQRVMRGAFQLVGTGWSSLRGDGGGVCVVI